MNGTEAETLGELSRQVLDLKAAVAELRGELRGGFITQDLYNVAHQDLEQRVQNNEMELKRVQGRPSWTVSVLITILAASNAALVARVLSTLG